MRAGKTDVLPSFGVVFVQVMIYREGEETLRLLSEGRGTWQSPAVLDS